MTPLAWILAALAGLGTFGFLGLVGAAVLRAQVPRSEPQAPPQVAELAAEVERLKIAVAGLPSLWEAEANRAEEAHEASKREHSRARAARSAAERARRGPEDDEGDDGAEDSDVLQLDAHRGGGGGMQSMRQNVAHAPAEDLARRALAAGWSPYL
jgi:hypothetical protein